MRNLVMVMGAAVVLACTPSTEELQARLAGIEAPATDNLDPASRQRLSEARQSLQASLAGADPDYDGILQLGRLYLAYDFPSAAAQALDLALELGVDGAEVHYLRAVAAVDLGDLESAATHFQTCLEREPDDLPAMFRLAQLKFLEGDPVSARALYLQALTRAPGHAHALAQLGRLDLEQGDAETAISRLKSALARQPEATALYYNLAAALGQMGRNEESRAALSMAGQRQPSIDDPRVEALQGLLVGAGPHLDLARRARDHGHVEVAVTHLQAALDYEPDNVTALHNLGVLRGIQGQKSEAVALLKRALARAPENADLQFDLATAMASSGQLEEAARHLERVLELRPEDLEARHRLDLIRQAIKGAGTP